MTEHLRGGSALRARLANVANAPPEFARTWAEDTRTEILRSPQVASAQRSQSRYWTIKALRLRAAVYGAYWWRFVDRGTKAHDILGSGGKNPPNVLMFTRNGQTIFASKVHHKRTRRQPFISRAAQGALGGSKWAQLVIRQWNGRRISGPHKAFL